MPKQVYILSSDWLYFLKSMIKMRQNLIQDDFYKQDSLSFPFSFSYRPIQFFLKQIVICQFIQTWVWLSSPFCSHTTFKLKCVVKSNLFRQSSQLCVVYAAEEPQDCFTGDKRTNLKFAPNKLFGKIWSIKLLYEGYFKKN